MAGSIPGPMGSVLTPQLIGIEQGLPRCPTPRPSAAAARRSARCRIPLPKLMRHWRERAVRPRPDARRPRARASALWGFVRQAAARSIGWPRGLAARALCACSAARGRLALGCRWPAAGPTRATCRRPQGAHLHEPVARAAGPPVSARDAILARVRLRPAAHGRGGGRGRRPRSPPGSRRTPRNLVPARGQLDREARIAAVRRAGDGGDDRRAPARRRSRTCPAAVTGYLREHNLPQTLVAGARAAARPGRLGQPAAAARPPRHGGRRRRGRRHAGGRRRRRDRHAGAGLGPRARRRCWPTCPRPASSCWPPTGSRRPTRTPGSRCAPCPAACRARSTSSPARRAPPTSPSSSELGAHGPRRLLILIVEQLDA